ncbi:hypothetical protein QF022_000917 [Vogesella perlucida]|nr:hypothetical protein [Vogesella perlucida]
MDNLLFTGCGCALSGYAKNGRTLCGDEEWVAAAGMKKKGPKAPLLLVRQHGDLTK